MLAEFHFEALEKPMNLLRIIAVLFACAVLLAACEQQSKTESAAQKITDALNQSDISPSGEGAVFKADLLSAIAQADKIVITEHSNRNDYYDPEDSKPYQGPIVEYGHVQLTAKYKADFAAIISALEDNTQDAFAACVFDPHHSVLFYAGGKLSSTMEICFECGQVEWSGSTKTPPWSIYSGLSLVVKNVGLSPDRDWRKLARAERNK